MDITKETDQEILEELAIRNERRKEASKLENMSPIGIWKVTTEGDYEGRTTKDLGVHEGHVVDIARALARTSMYGLRFESILRGEYRSSLGKCKSVSISLDIKTGTWDLDRNDRAIAIANWLRKEKSDNKYEVSDSNYYACVSINFDRGN